MEYFSFLNLVVFLQTFAFDHCFWSMAENHPKYSSKFNDYV